MSSKKQNQIKQQKKQQEYKTMIQKKQPKPPVLKNCFNAFWVGGSICLAGQFLQTFYANALGMDIKEASNPTVATVIFIGGLLTGLGIFDNIGKFAGAGTAVPVTGFANSMVSAAMEFKREGLVLGIGSKMFILAGSVIVFGVVTAFVVGLISAII
ncbi:stage V sporulation protein AC [Alkalicella caledoniensis]|uniref:Stage V sporulation protein AC n=1 Tax=Alkalicella caledoniensis TaxID=2731377 RepID=A0A7G9WBZ5_ALKCA|nr:stage V sporulation protein AC [Alkalicella caledoniensis]QNO16207.1 stage V sporulation protein AC [Alkalicella caledoniensis]